MDMIGLIFADQHDVRIDELTEKRTFAAIPFGARYRLIDFFLSNMTSAGILNIGVVTTTKYESLMGHIRYGAEWDLNRRKSGLTILPPFSFNNTSMRYENILEALQSNMSYLRSCKEKYVLFTCCNAIGNIDYSAMLRQHIDSGARFTCLCTRSPMNKGEGVPATEYKLDHDGRIRDILFRDHAPDGAYMATNTYIMERLDLMDILNKSIDKEQKSLRKDILLPNLSSSRIMAYETDESLLYIDSVSAYLRGNLALLEPSLRREFFRREGRPIITGAGNSAPGFYGAGSHVSNSLVAAGTVIEGEVRNSVIFRGVHIKKGAIVENSVINQDSTIGEGARLNYAVLDKGVVINDKRMLSGYITHPFFVSPKSII